MRDFELPHSHSVPRASGGDPGDGEIEIEIERCAPRKRG